MRPEVNPIPTAPKTSRKEEKSSNRAVPLFKFLVFVMAWGMLVGSGVFGSKMYLDHMRADIEAQLHEQTTEQTAQIHEHYDAQFSELKKSLTEEINQLQKDVQTFNELVTFTLDTANTNTDESNRLYTRLEQLEAQLEQLRENLDVLK